MQLSPSLHRYMAKLGGIAGSQGEDSMLGSAAPTYRTNSRASSRSGPSVRSLRSMPGRKLGRIRTMTAPTQEREEI
eukprot:scaffold653610_cov53-Prasinocladus_malaysianus.AAC.1